MGLEILCAPTDESLAFEVLQGMCWSDGKAKMEMGTGAWEKILFELKRLFPVSFSWIGSSWFIIVMWISLSTMVGLFWAALLKLNEINTALSELP